MRDVETLKPFTRFLMTIGTLPSSYLVSMTYEEQLLWFCNFLKNEVIPTVNNNAEAVIELQNYVSNYFDNLDVQEEINNKLDEMAESGELTDIIAQYLQLAGVLAFDTVSDMKQATNLVDGSICRTLGYYNINDGGGATYKIVETATPNEINIISLDNNLYAILQINSQIINGKQIGVHCDKVTDDLLTLQNAINFCKNNNYELLIDGYCYVSDSIDTKGIKINGVGKNPRPTATYTSKTYGYLGWDYLKNINNGALITFNDYVNDMLDTGSGIISDIANPILKCNTNDGKFNLNNLSIVGWLRNDQQYGIKSIYSTDSNTYINGKHTFNNVSVFNCGNTGIKLESLETTVVNNLNILYNFGYGLHIQEVATYDCPFEYVVFNNCIFEGNKLGNIYAKNSFRKSVKFNNCLITKAGLYAQLNLSVPETLADMISGVLIDGKSTYNNANPNILIFDGCYGEEQNCLIKINYNETGKALNNITIKNCTQIPLSDHIDTLAYINTYYTKTFNFYNNFSNSTNPSLVFAGNNRIIPGRVDAIFYDQYDNTPTLTVNANITGGKQNIWKYDNLIIINVTGTTTQDIAAYTTLVSNLPLPLDTIYDVMNVNNGVVPCNLYANGNLQCPNTIPSGSSLRINLIYYVPYQS